MNDFKFVYRDDELTYAKNALKTNDFVIYYYYSNSGLTRYLKNYNMIYQ